MWPYNIFQIFMLMTRNLELCPGGKNCKLDHGLSVIAQSFQLPDAGRVTVLCGLSVDC